jgi:putative SOS response-associated peptidase YedK
MCGRYTVRVKLNTYLRQIHGEAREAFIASLDVEMLEQVDHIHLDRVDRPRFNIAPSQDVFVIRQPDEKPELAIMRWGLLPPWTKELKSAPMLNNARSEEVAQKPTFRSIIKNKRCLIPADGFYEWEKIGKAKQPHYFGLKDFKPFMFAGLWQTWKGEEGTIDSCCIMTTQANELVGMIHDRMPVILFPVDYALWLDPKKQETSEFARLYEPFPTSGMESYLVDPKVNNARNEGAELVKPIEAPAEQQELF